MLKNFDRISLVALVLGVAGIAFLLLFEPVYDDCHMEGLDKVCKLTAWVRK